MRRLSKAIFLTCAIFLILAVPPLQAQVHLGLRMGGQASTLVTNQQGTIYRANPIVGFHIGLGAAVPIKGHFQLRPELILVTKGAKFEETYANHTLRSTSKPIYLELPINILFKPIIGNQRIVLGAGPYIAHAIAGRWKGVDTKTNDLETPARTHLKGQLIFGKDFEATIFEGDRKSGDFPFGNALDYGLNFLVGWEYCPQLSVQLNGQLGFGNISPKVDGQKIDISRKNQQLGLSIYYNFPSFKR